MYVFFLFFGLASSLPRMHPVLLGDTSAVAVTADVRDLLLVVVALLLAANHRLVAAQALAVALPAPVVVVFTPLALPVVAPRPLGRPFVVEVRRKARTMTRM